MQMLEDLALKATIRLLGGADDEDGQTLIEYGLIISFISLVTAAIVATIGAKVPTFFTTVADKLHS